MTIILGIDPGSRRTGFGIIKVHKKQHEFIHCGVIKPNPDADMGQRLYQIYAGLTDLIHTYHPAEFAIEQIFMRDNANTALKLGQARGAALAAAGSLALPIGEYSPRQIKQSLVGYGAAAKEQVAHMIKKLLNIDGKLSPDATDALAIAITHAHLRTHKVLI